MALTVSVTPGKQFANTELVTLAKLNQLGQPGFVVTGTVATSDFTSGSVVSTNVKPGPMWYADADYTSATNTYSGTWDTAPAFSANSFTAGTKLTFRANADHDNGAGDGICRLIVNNHGPFPIRRQGVLADISVREIRAEQIVDVVWSVSGGGVWEMQSQLAFPPVDFGTTEGSGVAYKFNPKLGSVSQVNQYNSLPELIGRHILLKFHVASSASPTLKVNNLAPAPLTKNSLTPIAAGDIPINSVMLVTYDGTQFTIAGQLAVPLDFYTTATGVGPYVTADISPGPLSYYPGLTVSVLFDTTQTFNHPTLALTSNGVNLGARDMIGADSMILAAGSIKALSVVIFVMNQSLVWQMQVPTSLSLPKAWANWTIGTVGSPIAPTSGYNVSSTTKVSSGVYTINFTNPLADVNYCVIAMARSSGFGSNLQQVTNGVFARTTSACRTQCTGAFSVVYDCTEYSIIVFGN